MRAIATLATSLALFTVAENVSAGAPLLIAQDEQVPPPPPPPPPVKSVEVAGPKPAPWEALIALQSAMFAGTQSIDATHGQLYLGYPWFRAQRKQDLYLGVGFKGSVGSATASQCQGRCANGLTGTAGVEARLGIAQIYTNDITGRPQAAWQLYSAWSLQYRRAQMANGAPPQAGVSLQAAVGFSAPYTWQTFHDMRLSGPHIKPPYFVPNHIEVCFEASFPKYLRTGGVWGIAFGYAF
jgi:hypothetical protein